MENKKIALCISGKPVSSMFCYPYIYDTFLNNDLNVDVFVHTWENCRVLDLYKPKKFEIEQLSQKEIVNYLLSQLQLRTDIKLEGRIDNVLLEYYGNNKVFELVDNTYDYVIRCRFDIIIQEKFDIKPIINQLNNNEYDIFFPDEVFNFGGYQNRVFMGKYSSMKLAMTLLQNLNFIANKINRWHPESFLKEHLDNNNIKIYQKDINHRIVRSSSIITNWPENPYNFLDL